MSFEAQSTNESQRPKRNGELAIVTITAPRADVKRLAVRRIVDALCITDTAKAHVQAGEWKEAAEELQIAHTELTFALALVEKEAART
jgi:hypothetical protein